MKEEHYNYYYEQSKAKVCTALHAINSFVKDQHAKDTENRQW